MQELPEIIAGPILRRVTENRVCVWLATSKEINYRLSIINQQSQYIGDSESGKCTSYQIGERLWVSLFEAWPVDKIHFPVDKLLSYQLWDQNNNNQVNLESVCLTGHSSPGFFIASDLNVLAYGSCRKPHGLSLDEFGKNSHIDTLSLLCDQLESNSDDLNTRPSLLCLTGDQIYADDVATPLINVLKQKASELMGSEFGVPGIDKPAQLAAGARMTRLNELDSGLTTSKGDNHLISFGEYAAMYLYVFGNCSNWEIKQGNDIDSQSLLAFSKSLAKVRTALANIPTYMIFDDHEVTDDWNITRAWYDGVRYSPCGRRIVSNALAAHWVFQAWGNSPESHDREFIRSINNHLSNPHDSVSAERFDLQMWKHRGWGFSVPSSPPIIALDTRTQRDFEGRDAPARLMDPYALDWLRVVWAQLQTRNVQGVPVIISATPVLGFDPVEKVQGISTILGVKAATLDTESWIANKGGFSYLMDTLLLRMKIQRVIFLSGDVHYSFVNKATYQSDGKTCHATQLTSSALKNSPKEGKYLDWLANLLEHTEAHKGIRSTADWPWYKRWLIFFVSSDKKHAIWKAAVTGIRAEGTESLLTNRSNIALVYFKQGKAVKQRLISGKRGETILDFNL